MNNSLQWQVESRQPVFEGHFPEFPIMPGVILIGFLKAHIFKELGVATELASIKRFRFVKPVLPGDKVTTNLKSFTEEGDLIHVVCSCTVLDSVVSKGKISLRRIDL